MGWFSRISRVRTMVSDYRMRACEAKAKKGKHKERSVSLSDGGVSLGRSASTEEGSNKQKKSLAGRMILVFNRRKEGQDSQSNENSYQSNESSYQSNESSYYVSYKEDLYEGIPEFDKNSCQQGDSDSLTSRESGYVSHTNSSIEREINQLGVQEKESSSPFVYGGQKVFDTDGQVSDETLIAHSDSTDQIQKPKKKKRLSRQLRSLSSGHQSNHDDKKRDN